MKRRFALVLLIALIAQDTPGRAQGPTQPGGSASTLKLNGAIQRPASYLNFVGACLTPNSALQAYDVACGGAGTVLSVTASLPLSSSGGVNPNISLTGLVPLANGGTGFDSSAGTTGQILRFSGAGVLGLSTATYPNTVNVGDIMVGSSIANIYGAIPDLALGRVLATQGVGSVPAYLAPGGDITGAIGAITVGQIQGQVVSNAAPGANNVLLFTGGAWTPTAYSALTIGSTLTGTSYVPSGPTTIGLNLSSINTWLAAQTFSNATLLINNGANTFHTTLISGVTANSAVTLQDAPGFVPVAQSTGTSGTVLHGSNSATVAGVYSTVANAELANSFITINGTNISLGGTVTVGAAVVKNVYTSNDTWTATAGTTTCIVEVIGGGGGGGGGAANPNSTGTGGGGGGGGGAYVAQRFNVSDMGSPATITVGLATGAAASANAGSGGNFSSFSSATGLGGTAVLLKAFGGGGGAAGSGTGAVNGGGGGGGTGAQGTVGGSTGGDGGGPQTIATLANASGGGGGSGATGATGFYGEYGGGGGAGAAALQAAGLGGGSSLHGGAGGGSGGGVTALNAVVAGGAGGSVNTISSGGGGGGGGAGSQGTGGTVGDSTKGGTGGGGGGSTSGGAGSGVGGAGADGGGLGGGGGGGGAGTGNGGGTAGGAGGKGARGEVRVTCQ